MMRVFPASLVACWLACHIFMKNALKRRQILRLLMLQLILDIEYQWEVAAKYWIVGIDTPLPLLSWVEVVLKRPWATISSIPIFLVPYPGLAHANLSCMCTPRGTNWIFSFGGCPFHAPFGSSKALTKLHIHIISYYTQWKHQELNAMIACQAKLSWRWWLVLIAKCLVSWDLVFIMSATRSPKQPLPDTGRIALLKATS